MGIGVRLRQSINFFKKKKMPAKSVTVELGGNLFVVGGFPKLVNAWLKHARQSSMGYSVKKGSKANVGHLIFLAPNCQ